MLKGVDRLASEAGNLATVDQIFPHLTSVEVILERVLQRDRDAWPPLDAVSEAIKSPRFLRNDTAR